MSSVEWIEREGQGVAIRYRGLNHGLFATLFVRS